MIKYSAGIDRYQAERSLYRFLFTLNSEPSFYGYVRVRVATCVLAYRRARALACACKTVETRHLALNDRPRAAARQFVTRNGDTAASAAPV